MLKYNPMSKEFQEETKRLGLTGNQLIQKYREEGKLKLIKKVNDEWFQKKGFKSLLDYENSLAIQKGFEDKKVRNREWHYEIGSLPISKNKDCSEHLDIEIAERKISRQILPYIFKNLKEMPYGHSVKLRRIYMDRHNSVDR